MRVGKLKEKLEYFSTVSEKNIIKMKALSEGLSRNRWLRSALGLTNKGTTVPGTRKPMPDEMKLSARNSILMTPEEKAKLEQEADGLKMPLQEYIRMKIQRKLGLRS